MFKNLINNNNIRGLPLAAWGALGFYRGVNYYNYDYEESLKKYEDYKNNNSYIYEKPEDYYVGRLAYGIMSSAMYVIPVMCIFPAIKELYRLEINLRGKEEKKKTREYNDILSWL